MKYPRATRRTKPLIATGIGPLLLLSSGPACAPAAEPSELSRHASAILGGSASVQAQDAVVLLERGNYESTCTGTVVGPTLILTARHCLFDYLREQESRLCEEAGGRRPILGAWPLASFHIFTGSEKPLTDTLAQAVAVHASAALDICDSDIAVVEVDTPLDVEPLALRLDGPPLVGETGVLVGWGATLEQAQTPAGEAWRIPDTRQQRDIEVRALGPSNYAPVGGDSRPVEAAAFVGTEGGCQGDSGAPLISTVSGAVIGVQYAVFTPEYGADLEPDSVAGSCIGGVTAFQRLDLQRELVRAAFVRAGETPWLEGEPRPAAIGEACEVADDCASGLCVGAGASHFCSRACGATPCPEAFECLGLDGQAAVCAPHSSGGVQPGAGFNCGLGLGSPGSGLVVAALIGCLRMLRRST